MEHARDAQMLDSDHTQTHAARDKLFHELIGVVSTPTSGKSNI
jgi:hypothetical protein